MELYAGTRDGLYRIDGGAELLAGGDVGGLHRDGDRLWAIVDDRALWRGGRRGGFGFVTAAPLTLRCLLATGGQLFAGTAEARLVRLDGDHFDAVAGFDEAPGRASWHTPWGGPPDTRSLAAAPDGAVYANVHVGGVPRSDDGGDTWTPTVDIHADVHQVVVAPSGTVLCAAAAGLGVSDDGEAWHWRTDGLHANYARAVAVAGGAVLLSVAEGPHGGAPALYRAALDDEAPLERCRTGLPEWFSRIVDTHCLVAEGRVAAAADGGTVYASDDGGETWDVLVDDLPHVRCLALA